MLNPSDLFNDIWRFYGDVVNPVFKAYGLTTASTVYVQEGLPAVGKFLKDTQPVPSHSFVKVLVPHRREVKLTGILSLPHYSNKGCFTISLVTFKF